jgi:hypothetical protein
MILSIFWENMFYPRQQDHKSITLHFTVDNLGGGSGMLTASLYSYLHISEHRAIVKLNGEVLGDPITWGLLSL